MATPPDFSVGQVLTSATMNQVGLWLIDTTTVSSSSIGFINGCFTSDYLNYRVNFACTFTAATNLRFRFRSGVSTVESGSVYNRFGFRFTTTISSEVSASQANYFIGTTVNSTAAQSAGVIDIFRPNVANINTVCTENAFGAGTTTAMFVGVQMATNTQYTGFEIFPDTGNMTGTISVYGYND
jgi:hypothetical protein